ncbi:MAG: hypothetical protein ACOYOA_15485 [Saprospiraceae bacterium]
MILFFAKQRGTTGAEIRQLEISSKNSVPATENINAEKDEDD